MSEALLELYQSVKEKLCPSPLQAHYIFSLHDLYRVVQGVMLLSPRTHIKRAKTKKKEGVTIIILSFYIYNNSYPLLQNI